MVPIGLRDGIARALPDDLVADIATRLYARRNWSRTRAFEVPGENKGYIRFNLRGRERLGACAPDEVEELSTRITDGLLTFRDPDGSPSISKVERMSALAGSGAAISKLPDLVVHWGERPAARVARVESPVHGEVVRRGVGSGRSGNHVDDAWAILAPHHARIRDIGRAPGITDIGATICDLMDADASGLSGTSLLERP
jgi:predicted AlkP superfamily phosphohydrolase/phosphomutase